AWRDARSAIVAVRARADPCNCGLPVHWLQRPFAVRLCLRSHESQSCQTLRYTCTLRTEPVAAHCGNGRAASPSQIGVRLRRDCGPAAGGHGVAGAWLHLALHARIDDWAGKDDGTVNGYAAATATA